MARLFAILALAVSVVACNAVNTLTEGFRHAKSVESELEQSTGLRPSVGFSWNNARLTSVTVTFPQLYESKPLSELAGIVRSTVQKHFEQTPEAIILGFALRSSPSGTVAQAQPTP